MRSSRVVRASDFQSQSCNSPGFDPCIIRHSGIQGAADEAVFNKVGTKKPFKVLVLWFGFSFAHGDFYLPRWLLIERGKRKSLKLYSRQLSEFYHITSGSEKRWPVGKIWPVPADLHAPGQAHGAQDQDQVQHPQPHLQRDIQLYGRLRGSQRDVV
jgi:hypothetical protein